MLGATIEARGRIAKTPVANTQEGRKTRMAYTWLAVPVADTSRDVMSQRKGAGKNTLWLRLVAFERVAEVLQNCLQGEIVSVTGSIQRNDRVDADGVRHTGLECKVTAISRARGSWSWRCSATDWRRLHVHARRPTTRWRSRRPTTRCRRRP